ncbi:gp137 [Bacillus phage W.Ph.]|uniref:Gp137 n=1 Tax=Bacillus phage W.Ph. TaxID=764595 RepID=G9B1N8_9CAUD|nr:gp137 [Bacillus phage W.Ph.]ADH03283.1 gp137 [Bacillus phage W.Ph.]
MMQYGDIPDARSMKTISKIHEINRNFKKSGEIREHIIKEISNAAKIGYTSIKITTIHLAITDIMYEFFTNHDNFSYIIKEFQDKGYRVVMTKESYSLLGSKPDYKSLFISWDDENEGDER